MEGSESSHWIWLSCATRAVALSYLPGGPLCCSVLVIWMISLILLMYSSLNGVLNLLDGGDNGTVNIGVVR